MTRFPRIRVQACFLAFLFALCFTFAAYAAESAAKYYKQGKDAEDHDDPITAYEAYKKAHKQKPAEIKYRTAFDRMRFAAATEYVHQGEKLKRADDLTNALVAFYKALEIDPSNEIAEQDAKETQKKIQEKKQPVRKEDSSAREMPKPGPPPHLDLVSTEPLTLHVTEQSDVVYRTIGKTAGLNVLIDPDYTPKRITVDLTSVTAEEALRIVGDLSNTFYKPVTHNTIFIAQNTRTKRQAIEERAVQVFYISNAGQQSDLNDVQTTIRQVLTNAKLYAVPSQNAIVVNGTPDELLLAKMLIASLDKPKAEVMVDITVMEVSRDKLRNLGLSPPTSITVSAGSSATLNQLGQTSAYDFSIGSATAELLLTDSDTRILQNPHLRASDGQKATLKIGSRIPIATGSYTSTTSTSGVETQFQYIDVGVNIEMTPVIHNDRDVTLKLSVEVSSETGSVTISSIVEPIIGQQKTDQTIRLKDGEASILAGLVKKQISTTVSGWPGLGEIPMLKYFFSTQSHEVVDDELVFMLVPHVVRAHEGLEDTQQIDTGTSNAVQIREVSAKPVKAP